VGAFDLLEPVEYPLWRDILTYKAQYCETSTPETLLDLSRIWADNQDPDDPRRGDFKQLTNAMSKLLKLRAPTLIPTPPRAPSKKRPGPALRLVFLSTFTADKTREILDISILQDDRSDIPRDAWVELCDIPYLHFSRHLRRQAAQEPYLLHLVGCCSRTEGWTFPSGKQLPTKNLRGIFDALTRSPLGVILWASRSASLAEQLAGVVPFAIGFKGEMDSDLCMAFAIEFHDLFLSGCTPRQAFEQACLIDNELNPMFYEGS